MGSFALAAAIREGSDAGREAAAYAGHVSAMDGYHVPNVPESPYRIEPARSLPVKGRGKAFVDFQNDVTIGDLSVANQEGFGSVEHLKRYTTLGMGTDQGKTGNVDAIRLMAQLRGLDMGAAGTTTFRPPFVPVSIGALAGRNIGHRFRPIRRSPFYLALC
jgi:methylglutamate dehydrogenase subunit C